MTWALLLVVWLCWGLSYPFMAWTLEAVDLITARLLANIGAGTLLLLCLGVQGKRLLPQREEWPGVLALSLLIMVVFPFALIAGVMLVGPGQAAILNYTMPLWASLLAVPVLGERLDRRTLMALGLGLAAVLLVLAGTMGPEGPSGLGVGLGLAAGATFGAGTVLSKRLRFRSPVLLITTWQAAAGHASGLGGVAAAARPDIPAPGCGARPVRPVLHGRLRQCAGLCRVVPRGGTVEGQRRQPVPVGGALHWRRQQRLAGAAPDWRLRRRGPGLRAGCDRAGGTPARGTAGGGDASAGRLRRRNGRPRAPAARRQINLPDPAKNNLVMLVPPRGLRSRKACPPWRGCAAGTAENAMPRTMQAAVFVEKVRIALREKPVPKIGSLHALLRITTTTIRGADIHVLKGKYPVASLA
ncbi:EamA family transporter [Dankookia sp. P2]|uniref:DMT family transporter n=1 Tax=Dankookia sp. P2 TaxID=3423955 RepID=UPI003D67D7B6